MTGIRTTEKHKLPFRSVSVSSAVVYLLFTGLIVYLCAPVLSLRTAPNTVPVEAYCRNHSYTLEGIIIREETLVPYPTKRFVPIVPDGQAVAADARVAICGEQFILAPAAGIYVQDIDGWEGLTADQLTELTPSKLDRLQNTVPASLSHAGKIISGNGWLFAATADADCAEILQEGQSARLTLSADTPIELTATILLVSPAENGRCAVVFRCIDHLQSTRRLRQITASVNGSCIRGLRIPTSAVCTDEAGSFVWRNSPFGAEKRYITILSEDNDYTIVSKDSSAHALHAGDNIICAPTEGTA